MGGWRKPSQNSRQSAFGDGDAEHLPFAMNARRTPQGIGNHHPFNPPANLDGCSGPTSPPARTFRSPRPESANPFSLPPGDGVSLDREPRPAPARPPAAQSDPKHSIEGRQNGSLTFSLQSRELESQGSIFDGDGLLTAQQESDESKDRQEKGWHVLRLFVPKSFQVNLLRADAIMANDTAVINREEAQSDQELVTYGRAIQLSNTGRFEPQRRRLQSLCSLMTAIWLTARNCGSACVNSGGSP